MDATGPVIEEISEEEAQAWSDSKKQNKEESVQQTSTDFEQQAPVYPDRAGFSQTIDSLKQSPELMRYFLFNHIWLSLIVGYCKFLVAGK